MAVVTKSIGTASRQYSSISLWEADLDDAGIYASGDEAVGELYDDSTFETWLTINGGGTVGLVSVTLKAAAGHQHDGTAGTGARLVATSTVNTDVLACAGTLIHKVIGLEIDANGFRPKDGGSILNFSAVTTNENRPIVTHNLLHGSISDSALFDNLVGIRFRVGCDTYNNIVYDITGWTSAHGLRTFSAARTLNWFNNTVHDLKAADTPADLIGFNLASDDTDYTLRNNLATGAATCFNSPSHSNTVQSHNASSDSTASGTGSLTSVVAGDTYVSTVAGSEDLKLKSGAVVIDAGTDLSASGVTDDIIGTARPQNAVYDIGAHEFVAAGGGVDALAVSGAIQVTGATPVATTTANVASRAVAGAVSIVGQTPVAAATANVEAIAGSGTAQIAGTTPIAAATENRIALATSGTAEITGQIPVAVATANVTALAVSGAAEITGTIPVATATANVEALAGSGAAQISGAIPVAEATENVSALAGAGSIAIAGAVPVAQTTANVESLAGAGAVNIEGRQPIAEGLAGQNAIAQPGAINMEGRQPVAAVTANVFPLAGAGVVEVTGAEPFVFAADNQNAIAAAGAIGITGAEPVAVASDHKEALAESGTTEIAGSQPIAETTGNVFAFPLGGEISITGFVPHVVAGTEAEALAGSGAIVIEGQQPIAISSVTASLVCGNITIASVLGGSPEVSEAIGGTPRLEKCA